MCVCRCRLSTTGGTPSSPSTASRSGGAPRAASSIPTPTRCSSWPIAAAATGAPRAPGSSTSNIRLCNRHGLRVTVAHYPPATSKWNPIEHRLFCEISKNWAGRPLDSYETILKSLRTTRTATGLRVRAHLVKRTYKTGVKVTKAQMRELRLTPDDALPKWNYTIEPM